MTWERVSRTREQQMIKCTCVPRIMRACVGPATLCDPVRPAKRGSRLESGRKSIGELVRTRLALPAELDSERHECAAVMVRKRSTLNASSGTRGRSR
jgi:hypothetical protein